MSLEQKVEFLKSSMNSQLSQVAFTANGNIKLPTKFLLNNIKTNASNEISVDSKEQSENIRSIIGGTLVDSVNDYNKPLYLSVEVSLPQ